MAGTTVVATRAGLPCPDGQSLLPVRARGRPRLRDRGRGLREPALGPTPARPAGSSDEFRLRPRPPGLRDVARSLQLSLPDRLRRRGPGRAAVRARPRLGTV